MIDPTPLTTEEVEAAAGALLEKRGKGVLRKIGPAPVEEIAELDLELTLEVVPFLARFLGLPMWTQISGALVVGKKQLLVDGSAEEHNARFRFTVAHEIGHWILHRGLVKEAEPIICLAEDKARVIERQANDFASSLLMPRRPLLSAWKKFAGRTAVSTDELFKDKQVVERLLAANRWLHEDSNALEMLGAYVEPLAYDLQVSRTALRIRLEAIGAVVHSRSRRAKPKDFAPSLARRTGPASTSVSVAPRRSHDA